MIGARPAGSALDQEHGQGEEQVEVLQAGLREGGLPFLIQAAAGVNAVSQQQPRGFQAEFTDLGSVLRAGLQGLLHQEHQRGLHCFTIDS